MKRTIEISASFTGVISTGQFQNEKPLYHVKETIELDNTFTDAQIADRQRELHEICYQQFKKQAERAETERIAKEYEHLKFYETKDGIKYPSVTSILGINDDFTDMPADELAQYSSRGTIIHKQVEIFLKTGEWKETKDIPEIYPDLLVIKQGNLKLQLDGYDFKAFFKKYPFKVLALEEVVLNDEYRYGGRFDIKCVIESSNKGDWDKIEGILFDVPTILDVKTGQIDTLKHMKQQTFYAHTDSSVGQIGLIPLNSSTKQGFSKPEICSDVNKYWALALDDRQKFQKRYGI